MLKDALLLQVVREVNAGWQRKKYEGLLIELGLYSISTLKDNEEFSGLTKYDLILATLRTHDQAELLVEINKRHEFSGELIQAFSEAGINLESEKKGAESTRVTEPVNTSHSETNPGTAVGQPGPIKDIIQGQTAGNKMKKNKLEITEGLAIIIAALIALLGIIVGAFLTPWAAKLINQPTPTPKPTSLAIEQIPYRIYSYYSENAVCCAGSALFEYGNNADRPPGYSLIYTMPSDKSKSSFGGIAFEFTPSLNISEYQYVKFTITFSGQASQIDVKFEDIAKTQESIHETREANSTNPINVPLASFSKIDFKAIRIIAFEVKGDFAPGSGRIGIKDIQFSK